ncbi:MAG: TA system VapC family ribonuclease toxin [Burkholderiaceae bacterium]
MSLASVCLLDANLLIALTHSSHVHHAVAQQWFNQARRRQFATCALTQLAFVRLSSNPRVTGANISPAEAMEALAEWTAHPGHVFWPDILAPVEVPVLNSPAVVGYRQVTDAYLLGLASAHKQKLATLDRALLTFASATGLTAHLEWIGGPSAVHEPRPVYARSAARRR